MRKMKKTFMGLVLVMALFFSSLITELSPMSQVQASTISKGTYTIDSTINGTITDGLDTHVYTFSLSKATLLELNYHAINRKWKYDDIYFAVYNENGNEAFYLISENNNNKCKSVFLEPGDYSIEIWGDYRDSYRTDYTFSFTNRGTQKETFTYANDFTSDVANKQIPFNTTIHGMLAINEENDYYCIDIPKKGTIQINVTDNFGGYYYLTNTYGWSDRIDINSAGRGSKSYSVSKGTYYFKVNSSSRQGAYSFKVSYNKSSTKTFTVKKKSKTSMVVKASATGATSGYQIKYRPSSGKWKTITVSGKKLNKTIKKLKKSRTYQVKIRTYYTYGGKKIYSSWGKTKKVKLK